MRFVLSKTFLANALLAILGFVAAYFILRWSLDMATHHEQKIEVPDLAGLNYLDAQVVLEEQKLNFEILDSSEFNNAYEGHAVWVQYPKAGSFVKEGRPIRLTINPTKEPLIELPDLIERTKRRAVYDLRTKGFRVGELTYVPYIGKDVVVKVLLKGKEVKGPGLFPKGTQFDLVLGGGLSSEKVIVPWLARKTFAEAEESLLANSLNLGVVFWELDTLNKEEIDSNAARVYRQDPEVNTNFGVPMGSSVDLWLTDDSTKWPIDTLSIQIPDSILIGQDTL